MIAAPSSAGRSQWPRALCTGSGPSAPTSDQSTIQAAETTPAGSFSGEPRISDWIAFAWSSGPLIGSRPEVATGWTSWNVEAVAPTTTTLPLILLAGTSPFITLLNDTARSAPGAAGEVHPLPLVGIGGAREPAPSAASAVAAANVVRPCSEYQTWRKMPSWSAITLALPGLPRALDVAAEDQRLAAGKDVDAWPSRPAPSA